MVYAKLPSPDPAAAAPDAPDEHHRLCRLLLPPGARLARDPHGLPAAQVGHGEGVHAVRVLLFQPGHPQGVGEARVGGQREVVVKQADEGGPVKHRGLMCVRQLFEINDNWCIPRL